VWDSLPVAVLIVAVLWCVVVPCLEALMGPFSRPWVSSIVFLVLIATPLWALCAGVGAVTLVLGLAQRRGGAGRTLRRLAVLAAASVVFWASGQEWALQIGWRLKSYGFKRAVMARVSIGELREATAVIADDPRWRGERTVLWGRHNVAKTPGVPAAILRLRPDRLTVVPRTREGRGHLGLWWNPDYHVEVDASPPPPRLIPPDEDRWAEGVYGYIAIE
jgi:hypothetical protein